jgi:hypothetical protein
LVLVHAGKAQTEDVEATLHQSVVDKILNSLNYPYTVFDGSVQGARDGAPEWHRLSDTQMSKLIKSLNAKPKSRYNEVEQEFGRLLEEVKAGTEKVISYLQSGKSIENAPPLEDVLAAYQFWSGKSFFASSIAAWRLRMDRVARYSCIGTSD